MVKVDLTTTAAGTPSTELNALLLLSSDKGSAHKGDVGVLLPSNFSPWIGAIACARWPHVQPRSGETGRDREVMN